MRSLSYRGTICVGDVGLLPVPPVPDSIWEGCLSIWDWDSAKAESDVLDFSSGLGLLKNKNKHVVKSFW